MLDSYAEMQPSLELAASEASSQDLELTLLSALHSSSSHAKTWPCEWGREELDGEAGLGSSEVYVVLFLEGCI